MPQTQAIQTHRSLAEPPNGGSSELPALDNIRPTPAAAAVQTDSDTPEARVMQASHHLPDGNLLLRAGSNRGEPATIRAATPETMPTAVPANKALAEARGHKLLRTPICPLQSPRPAVQMQTLGLSPVWPLPSPSWQEACRKYISRPRMPTSARCRQALCKPPRIQASNTQPATAQPTTAQPTTAQPATAQPATAQSVTTQSAAAQSTVQQPSVGPGSKLPSAAGAAGEMTPALGLTLWGKPIVQRRAGVQRPSASDADLQASTTAPFRRWSVESPAEQLPVVGQVPVGQSPDLLHPAVPAAGYPLAPERAAARPPDIQAAAETAQAARARTVCGQSSGNGAGAQGAPVACDRAIRAAFAG